MKQKQHTSCFALDSEQLHWMLAAAPLPDTAVMEENNNQTDWDAHDASVIAAAVPTML